MKLNLYEYNRHEYEDGETTKTLRIGVLWNLALLHFISIKSTAPYSGVRVLFTLLSPNALIGIDFFIKGRIFNIALLMRFVD